MRANPTNSRLFRTKAPSREKAASIPTEERRASPRQAISTSAESTTTAKKLSRSGPNVDELNACTDWTTPDRVKKVASTVSAKQATARVRFQTRSRPRRSSTTIECT